MTISTEWGLRSMQDDPTSDFRADRTLSMYLPKRRARGWTVRNTRIGNQDCGKIRPTPGGRWTGIARRLLLGVHGSLCANTLAIVFQVVGPCKTEASQKPIPLDAYLAEALKTHGGSTHPTENQMIECLRVPLRPAKNRIGDKLSCGVLSAPLQ